jgi:hypothetical protein
VAGKPPQVALIGMKALRNDLARIAGDNGVINDALKKAGKTAVEPIYTTTQASVPRDSGTLAGDVRSSGTRTGATVRMGRAGVPYAGWIEFGGTRDDGSERDFFPQGRYEFPAARSLATTAADIYSREISSLLDRYTWTNSGANAGSVHD